MNKSAKNKGINNHLPHRALWNNRGNKWWSQTERLRSWRLKCLSGEKGNSHVFDPIYILPKIMYISSRIFLSLQTAHGKVMSLKVQGDIFPMFKGSLHKENEIFREVRLKKQVLWNRIQTWSPHMLKLSTILGNFYCWMLLNHRKLVSKGGAQEAWIKITKRTVGWWIRNNFP